jgi:hypothetical protein
MPTLDNYAQQEVARLTALETAARAELSAAQAELATRTTDYAEALDDLRDAEAVLVEVRRQLGGSEVPADANSGGDDLRDALIEHRKTRAALHLARLAVLVGEDRLAAAKTELEGVSAGLSKAKLEQVEYAARSQQIATWVAAVGVGTPLAALPAAATALLATAAYTDALAKINASLPSTLRDRAIERLVDLLDDEDAQVAHVAGLDDEFDGVFTALGGTSGQLPAAERALTRAEAALGEFVGQGARWLAEATARLAAIAARRTLTVDESAALATNATRTAALTAEDGYDAAAKDLAATQRLLERKLAELYAADPDADVEADPDVIAHRAQLLVDQAAMTMPGTTAEDMIAWQAEVPEFVWDDLLDLRIAKRLLDKLAAIVPATLASTATAAEIALAAALQAELDVDRRLEPIDALADAASDGSARARKTTDERRRAVIRGLR